MFDYKAIARAITDPENQPHQWTRQDLAKLFRQAASDIDERDAEIERMRDALKKIEKIDWGFVCQCGEIATAALQSFVKGKGP